MSQVMKWKAVSKEQAEAAQSLGFNVELRFFAELPTGVRLPRNGTTVKLALEKKHSRRGGKRSPHFKLRLTAKDYEWRTPGITSQVYDLIKNEAFKKSLTTELTRTEIINKIATKLPKGTDATRVKPLLSDLVKRDLLRRVK